jgi:epoxyqueuosine reductase
MTPTSIKSKARELGFAACGIARADDYPELRFFDEWLARGYDGEMTYLRTNAERRRDVRHVVPGARSVIATATLYNTGRPYSTEIADPSVAQISRYAWGDDYHDIIKRQLGALLAWMYGQTSEPFAACAYVDTGPVLERVYAQRAGIGWIGKNTCVIHPALGSWLFLGEIICTLDLEPDRPAIDQCGTCTLCLEACPTQAIVAPGELDARRCISYLTIEKRGDIPPEFHHALGAHVYGCDICQEVCPWNHRAPIADDAAWQPRGVWAGATIQDLASRSDDELRAGLKGSAMRRTKVAGLRRNLQIASRNRDESTG